ncbi:hypothetical protein [Streptomyces sp. GC420]|uniref:hypothetical protein n=1 Tax=Streptomyces sp. GC420 TaxID=2697568 RepID=UPI001415168F|nr:hypothetical protein [Streptomyces sp. GC420]NBM20116.1 hypothetical protein [Streptomyces sp. GC420]
MARSSSGIVAGLTAAAIAAIGFLAYQASANVPDTLGGPARPGTTATASPSASPGKDEAAAVETAIPAGSGSGARVVYDLDARRVWLVGEDETASRTFEVMPSAVDPAPGTYTVTSRTGEVTGSDGVPVEHVVRFTSVDGVSVGFSAAVDGTLKSPDPSLKTGGIRQKRADGNAMWTFATIGTKVVVVP